MQLYNTASRSVETLTPQNNQRVTFYACGPTVYDYPHIGNWYTFVRYDLIYRSLKAAGYDVEWVMNITDVGHLTSDADEGEDKLEKGAKREGATAWDVAKKYTDYFMKGLERLNMSSPTHLPKATEHIAEQIKLIQQLEQNGHTYVIDDGVYFDTSTFPNYGKMAHLDLAHLKEGARVEINQQKRHPADFALWKFSPANAKRDMEWESPWGIGFPGWHIECSAMSMKYLGETLDIHAGGIDHIPVHHTNEIAQSEGATDKLFSKYWVHMNFILVDGRKMAKSDGTFITLEDIEAKGFDLRAFRLMVLQSHYRTEAHFSWENLAAAQNLLTKLQAWADLRFQHLDSDKLATNYQEAATGFKNELLNDLNTPAALAYLSGMINRVEELGVDRAAVAEAVKLVDALFGLNLSASKDLTNAQYELLQSRQAARDNNDWAKADELRDQLRQEGIEIRDTAQGQVWARLSV